jgi:hypothetical protein
MPDVIDSPNAPPAPPKPGTLSTLVTAGANLYATREERKAAERDAKRAKSDANIEAARAAAAADQARLDIARMQGNTWIMPAILLGGAGIGLFLFMRSNRKSRRR